MRGLLILLLLAALAAVLFLTNPTRADFAQYVEDEAGEFLGQAPTGGLLGQLGGLAAGRLAATAVDRTDYLLFSTYTLDLDQGAREGGEYEFLGIAGTFFPTKEPGEGE